jgi:hypothetical protein
MAKKDEKKVLPINKYSIYELKSGIDQCISSFLESNDFKESQRYSNLKIFVGLITLSFTALAYLYPKPYPQNYNAIVIGCIGYWIFSTLYWIIEKWVISNIFYIGNNPDYCQKIRPRKHYKIKEIIINSEIKDKTSIYNIWFNFSVIQDNKIFKSEIRQIDCTKVYDERGFIDKEATNKFFKTILNEELAKID